MNDATCTTLDYIEQIAVPGRVFDEPANEYWQLRRLWIGMEFLYLQATKFDEDVTRRIPNGGILQFGGSVDPMLENAFDWYSVSACKYVRLVGEIARRFDSTRPIGKDYAKVIIPDVETYRDKVAAHFAWSTENKRDNPAERLVSVLPNIVFQRDTYYAAGLTVYRRSGDNASTSEAVQPWSISKTHPALRARYEPLKDDGGNDTSRTAS